MVFERKLKGDETLNPRFQRNGLIIHQFKRAFSQTLPNYYPAGLMGFCWKWKHLSWVGSSQGRQSCRHECSLSQDAHYRVRTFAHRNFHRISLSSGYHCPPNADTPLVLPWSARCPQAQTHWPNMGLQTSFGSSRNDSWPVATVRRWRCNWFHHSGNFQWTHSFCTPSIRVGGPERGSHPFKCCWKTTTKRSDLTVLACSKSAGNHKFPSVYHTEPTVTTQPLPGRQVSFWIAHVLTKFLLFYFLSS